MLSSNPKITLLATNGSSTNWVFNTLANHYSNVEVIIEKKISRTSMVKGRLKKLGLIKTLGQLLFIASIAKILGIYSKKRISEIHQRFGLNECIIGSQYIKYISSVNNPQIIEIISQLNPDLIIVNGTRIISSHIIHQLSCPIINIHTGITPYYRGVHGGYWALFNNDIENFGTTVHFLDAGIDSGSVIRHYRTQPANTDNFLTYPLLQYGIMLPDLVSIVAEVLIKADPTKLNVKQSNIPPPVSKGTLYYHPTLGQYLFGLFWKGVK